MVMVWLEGGQGEVRGAYAPLPTDPPRAPPHPNRPSRTPHAKPLLDPPPNSRLPEPPLQCPPPPPPPPPPQGASGQQLVGGGSWHP